MGATRAAWAGRHVAAGSKTVTSQKWRAMGREIVTRPALNECGDVAFANPALYRLLEKEGYHYTIRIKANAVLEREIDHLLTRPVGRPSRKPKVFYHSFQYQAASWRQ